MNKIDTQGMSVDKSDFSCSVSLTEASPFYPKTRNVFTDLERSELKSIFTECLQEFFNEQESECN